MALTGADSTDATTETSREASAVFTSAAELQSAVDALLAAGFTRDDICVLGSEEALRAQFGDHIPDAAELADNSKTPRRTFVSSDSRSEGLAALAGIPVYSGLYWWRRRCGDRRRRRSGCPRDGWRCAWRRPRRGSARAIFREAHGEASRRSDR